MSDIGIGETLRTAREEQGRTLEEASRDTRVRADYLRALEEDQFDGFGGDVYAKGFLSTYARYLKLDPGPLLERYRRFVKHDEYDTSALASGPVAALPSGSVPPWVAWALVAVVILGGAMVVIGLFGGRTPDPAGDQTAPPQPAASQPATQAPSEPAQPSPSPTPTYEGVNVVLAFEGTSWISVTVDGETVQEGTIQAGEVLEFQGDEEIRARLGNAGGVRAELNGEDLGAQGGQGEVVTVTFTPDGASTA